MNDENKPSINGVELTSDMSLEDIGIIELTPEMVNELFLETFGVVLQSYHKMKHILLSFRDNDINMKNKFMKKARNNNA